MRAPRLDIIDDPARARMALQPIRLQLLHLLERPQSAPQVAKALGMPRQRVRRNVARLERPVRDATGFAESTHQLVEDLRKGRGAAHKVAIGTRPCAFSRMRAERRRASVH